MKIEDININDIVLDKDNAKCIITNKTSSSIEVYIEKKTNKGINHKQWFTDNEFLKRFKKI